MADFRKLRVWHEAQALAVDVNRIAARMRGPASATLRDQMTRAAMSVPTNIVEACAHESPRETARFLSYSIASVTEVEGHAELARNTGMISAFDFETIQKRVNDVRKMLYGLLKRVNSRKK